MSELLEHFSFIEPKGFLSLLDSNDELTNEWMQIFYIARIIFCKETEFPIKSQLSPLLERKEIFPKDTIKKNPQQTNSYESLVKVNMSGSLDIGKITAIHQISHILPREFVIYPEDFFYTKLIKKELYRKEFNEQEGFSIDDLVYGKEQGLNRKQKIYILFDNSFSMNGDKFNKLFAAKAICLEYLRRAQKESPQIYFRYFNQDRGPLIKITKRGQIKDLIRYVIHLNTHDCHETLIDEAILDAVEDIKLDPELRQAEILMITDGLGDVPANIEKRLGKIKFHMVLIPGANIGQFLTKYPDKEAWGKLKISIDSAEEFSRLLKEYPNKEAVTKANIKEELKSSIKRILEFYPDKKGWGKADNQGFDIPPYWDTFLQLIQVYRLQEVADIFIKIPSLFNEKFNFSNMYELEQIKKVRENLVLKLEGTLSNSERYEVFQKIKFFMNYLQMLLFKEPTTKELQKSIRQELNRFQILLKKIMQDKWFVSTLDTSSDASMEESFKKTGKGLAFKLKESHKPWMLTFIPGLIKFLVSVPQHMIDGFSSAITKTRKWGISVYRNHKLKRKFNYIKGQMGRRN